MAQHKSKTTVASSKQSMKTGPSLASAVNEKIITKISSTGTLKKDRRSRSSLGQQPSSVSSKVASSRGSTFSAPSAKTIERSASKVSRRSSSDGKQKSKSTVAPESSMTVADDVSNAASKTTRDQEKSSQDSFVSAQESDGSKKSKKGKDKNPNPSELDRKSSSRSQIAETVDTQTTYKTARSDLAPSQAEPLQVSSVAISKAPSGAGSEADNDVVASTARLSVDDENDLGPQESGVSAATAASSRAPGSDYASRHGASKTGGSTRGIPSEQYDDAGSAYGSSRGTESPKPLGSTRGILSSKSVGVRSDAYGSTRGPGSSELNEPTRGAPSSKSVGIRSEAYCSTRGEESPEINGQTRGAPSSKSVGARSDAYDSARSAGSPELYEPTRGTPSSKSASVRSEAYGSSCGAGTPKPYGSTRGIPSSRSVDARSEAYCSTRGDESRILNGFTHGAPSIRSDDAGSEAESYVTFESEGRPNATASKGCCTDFDPIHCDQGQESPKPCEARECEVSISSKQSSKPGSTTREDSCARLAQCREVGGSGSARDDYRGSCASDPCSPTRGTRSEGNYPRHLKRYIDRTQQELCSSRCDLEPLRYPHCGSRKGEYVSAITRPGGRYANAGTDLGRFGNVSQSGRFDNVSHSGRYGTADTQIGRRATSCAAPGRFCSTASPEQSRFRNLRSSARCQSAGAEPRSYAGAAYNSGQCSTVCSRSRQHSAPVRYSGKTADPGRYAGAIPKIGQYAGATSRRYPSRVSLPDRYKSRSIETRKYVSPPGKIQPCPQDAIKPGACSEEFDVCCKSDSMERSGQKMKSEELQHSSYCDGRSSCGSSSASSPNRMAASGLRTSPPAARPYTSVYLPDKNLVVSRAESAEMAPPPGSQMELIIRTGGSGLIQVTRDHSSSTVSNRSPRWMHWGAPEK